MGYRRVTIAFLIAAAALGAQTHTRKARKAARIEDPRFDAAVVNAATQPEIQMGQKGAAVLRAQILLDRAGFSPGQIDGEFGSNLAKALGAFLKERQLPGADRIDAAAWAALNADTAPALTSYTLSDSDVKGPYKPVPNDIVEQAKLPALGFSSLMEALGERFHVAPEVLKALNPGTSFAKAGQQAMVPNVMTMPPGEAARIVVSKSESSVRAYGADGKLLAFYVATIGSEHDPLPVGEWKIRVWLGTRSSITTPTSSGTQSPSTPKRRSSRGRTIRSGWCGSTSRKTIMASTGRPSRRGSGTQPRTGASG